MQDQIGLPEGTVLKGKYRLGQVVGRGGFGITYDAYDIQNQRSCAVKEFYPREICSRDEISGKVTARVGCREMFEAGRRQFDAEAEVLQKLQEFQAVVRVWEYFPTNSTAFYVMERLVNPDLKKLIKNKMPFSIDRALELFLPIIWTMDEIHRKKHYVHRDISPENLMFAEDGTLRLFDFGSAINMEDYDKEKNVEFKPGFAPLEQYSSRSEQGPYTDVYAMGATFYYMVTGNVIPESLRRKRMDHYVSLKNCVPRMVGVFIRYY